MHHMQTPGEHCSRSDSEGRRLEVRRVLVTGAAGFIGFHLARRLLTDGISVVGIDVVNDYYDPRLKWDRLAILQEFEGFSFVHCDIAERECVEEAFDGEPYQVVVHLAAQAGVRHSIDAPAAYVRSNVLGSLNILEACRHHGTAHLVYASSSSVYGANDTVPFSEHHPVDHPVSLYAATKRATELMAHTYSHLFEVPATGVRFFTVYGPWGRPDMALFKFTRAIVEGRPVEVYNRGEMRRDFTYVDDVVEALVRLLPLAPAGGKRAMGDPASADGPFKVYNIGCASPVHLMDMIAALEKSLGREAVKHYMDMQPGDVAQTYADVSELQGAIDYRPRTTLEEGIEAFVGWYREYYGLDH